MTAGAALYTDYYELTMAQAYFAEGLGDARATFSLFLRELPPNRNYAVVCGLDEVSEHLQNLHVSEEDLAYLRSRGDFSESFLSHLAELRFTGEVYAVPEGTPIFPDEPVLEVEAPLVEAQLVETYLMNAVTAQSAMATKAARLVSAAKGRPVVDFGLRRGHGGEGGIRAARAHFVGGVDATSNVLAGLRYGLPVSGTMAHSYIQAHDSERDAFRSFLRAYPDAILLVDTYDTLAGVRRVAELARDLGGAFRARGVRLDSGDLDALSRGARRILDEAGLERLSIFASGGLDEYAITSLLEAGAPIDGFGVGSALAASTDAPTLETAYKLTELRGTGRMKLSTGKATRPGRKQIARARRGGVATGDVVGRSQEPLDGDLLLVPIMTEGERAPGDWADLEAARARCREELGALPTRIRALAPADPPYPVEPSPGLSRLTNRIATALR